jgi:hypothetical protein
MQPSTELRDLSHLAALRDLLKRRYRYSRAADIAPGGCAGDWFPARRMVGGPRDHPGAVSSPAPGAGRGHRCARRPARFQRGQRMPGVELPAQSPASAICLTQHETRHTRENPADIPIEIGRAQAYKLYLSKASLPPAEDRCQRSNPIPYFTLGKRSPFIRGEIRPHALPPFAAFIASTIERMVGRFAEIGVGFIHLGNDIGHKTGRTSGHDLVPR